MNYAGKGPEELQPLQATSTELQTWDKQQLLTLGTRIVCRLVEHLAGTQRKRRVLRCASSNEKSQCQCGKIVGSLDCAEHIVLSWSLTSQPRWSRPHWRGNHELKSHSLKAPGVGLPVDTGGGAENRALS